MATIGQAATNTWLEVDISSVVAPNTTVSLAILPGNNDGLDVSSRNSSTNKPQIVIETGSSGSPGNTSGGTQGGRTPRGTNDELI